LAERPDQFAKVKADHSLIPGLVEEAIRWVTPVKHFMRSATQDTELAGQKIAKGDWLMLAYPSGNRDETVFRDPFAFDVERTPNKQLAFGYGAHVCLGQHLARMEMKILWEELLPRLQSVGTGRRAQKHGFKFRLRSKDRTDPIQDALRRSVGSVKSRRHSRRCDRRPHGRY
jgi:cytochrome P450